MPYCSSCASRQHVVIPGQPPNLWRPQQFYTGRVGLPPSDAPALTASDWNKEAPTSGHVEALFAEKTAAKDSHTQQTADRTHASPAPAPAPEPAPAEIKINLPLNVEMLAPSLATTQAVISIATKSDSNNEAKEARVISFEVPQLPAEAVPVEAVAQMVHVAPAA